MMPKYWQILSLLQAPVVLGGIIAWLEGWLVGSQVMKQSSVPDKYLTYLEHGGVLGLIPLNFVVAWIVVKHSDSWDALMRERTLLLLLIPCLLMVWGWTLDDVPSALVRNRMPTLPGVCNFASFWYISFVVIMYFLFTPNPPTMEIILVASALALYVAAGILEPPYAVHGSIHAQA